MATPLERLPAELLGPISSELSARDILSLSKSCKGLYSQTYLLLFRHVTINWDVAKRPEKTPHITRLLELILKNPDYARYIKRVEIVNIKYEHFNVLAKKWDEQGIRSPLSLRLEHDDSLARLVRNVISELCLPDPGEWYKGVVEDADLGAIVALLLAQCTQLHSLKVNLDFIAPSAPWGPRHKWLHTGINPWFRTMFGHAVSAPGEASRLTRFNKLTEFTISPPGQLDRQGLELPRDVFFSSFYLPNITTLSLDHALDHRKPERLELAFGRLKKPTWPFPNKPLASKLTTLSLTGTTASTSAVEFLLRQTPNLQSLVYDCTQPTPVFDLDDLQRALGHVRDTLRQLVVRFRPDITPVMGFSGVYNSAKFLRLRKLSLLEDLNISLGVLYGSRTEPKNAPPLSKALPASLKRLTINDDLWQGQSLTDTEWRFDHSGTLLKTFFGGGGGWKRATPLLEEFVLDMWKNGAVRSDEYWGCKEIREELQTLVESQGIRCSILWNDDAEPFTLGDILAGRSQW